KTYGFDTRRPPLPKNARANPGENAINVRWDALDERQGEVRHYQVLCAKADGSPAFPSPRNNAEYDTPAGLCDSPTFVDYFSGSDSPPGPDAGPNDEIDAGPGDAPDAGAPDPTLPDWMTNLDDRYVCGTGAATARNIRIGGL